MQVQHELNKLIKITRKQRNKIIAYVDLVNAKNALKKYLMSFNQVIKWLMLEIWLN